MGIRDTFEALKSGKGLKGQLMRGGIGSLALKVVSTALGLALGVILARTLGAEGYGIYSFAFALLSVLAIPAQLGFPNLVVRETAKAHLAEKWGELRGLWRGATLAVLSLSLLLSLVGVTITLLVRDSLAPLLVSTLLWGFILVPLIALNELRGAALRGLRRVILGQAPEYILRPTLFIVFILVWFIAAGSFGPDTAMIIHLLSAFGAFLCGAFLLRIAQPSELSTHSESHYQWRFWLQSSLPLAALDGMYLLNQNVGLIVLGVWSTPTDVGLLRVSMQGAFLISFALSAINISIGPYLARLYQQSDAKNIQAMVTLASRVVLISSSSLFIIFVIFGDFLLEFMFGDEYAEAYLPMLIISLGHVLGAIGAVSGVLLNMTGNEKITAQGVALGASINVVATLSLVPAFGILGAAIASAISMSVWNLVLWRRAIQFVGIDCSPFKVR